MRRSAASHGGRARGAREVGAEKRVNRKACSRLARRSAGARFSGMSITAIVENDTIKLPMHVPDGTRVEITLPAESPADAPGGNGGTLHETLKDFIGKAEGLPEDFAAEHDHYIHGTPKRSGA